MRKKGIKRSITLALSLLMLCAAALPASAEFSDVVKGSWYENYISQITQLSGIINGYSDGTFRPDNNVTRGEFLKMIFEAAMNQGGSGFRSTTERDRIHWAGKYYTMAMDSNILVADVYSGSGVLFECTYAELEKSISRYEAAVILTNVCTNVGMETTVKVTDPASHIADYTAIEQQYVNSVEQAYGKGLLNGMADGSFSGEANLRRSEAAAIIYRFLWANDRAMPDWAEVPEVQTVQGVPAGYVPFAIRYRSMSVAERQTALFGNPNKTYFTSAADAAGFMETVTIPIWTLDQNGNKVASTANVTVHKLVATDVRLIFEEIFNDPERFPIYGGWSVGGARFTDTMRHSWGCAIDINAFYNCECTVNWNSRTNRVTCGYGWWPASGGDDVFHGSMTGPSPYSIIPGNSVVRAFANYGWGWGGNGWGVSSYGNEKYDYMHFSILQSGG